MSTERGLLLEQLQEKGRRMSRIGSQRERLHGAIGKSEVRPTSWEDVLRIGRVKAEVADSVGRINDRIQTVDESIEAERQRLVAKAASYDSELLDRSRDIAALTHFEAGGHLPDGEYASRLNDFRMFKNDPEIPTGKKLLKEQNRRERKGRTSEPIWVNSSSENLKDEVIYVNEELRAVAVGGKEVRFEEGIEWQALQLLVSANQANRYNAEGQYVSSSEINELVVRPNGGGISASGLIENIRNRSEVVSGPDDFVLAEQSYPLKGTIETRVEGRWTAHRLTGRVRQFNGPEKVLIPKGVSLDPTGRPKVVPIRPNSEETLASIERIYPDTRVVVNLILDDFARKGIIRPIMGLQLMEYYTFLSNEFMAEMYSRGYIKPVRGNDHYHGAYTAEDIATVLFIRGFKITQNVENSSEIEDGQRSIRRRQVKSQQVRQLRRIIGQEISKRALSVAK